MGQQSYASPKDVLEAIVDEVGERFAVGQETDIGQFNELFISRLVDAFKAAKQQSNPVQKKKYQNDFTSDLGYKNTLLSPVTAWGCEESIYPDLAPLYVAKSVSQEEQHNEMTSLFYGKQTSVRKYKD